ncbi:Sau3AI family type II restriction endonuclease [Rossellomorea vietnamensis]|uniref:Sau3AI family type II restriction endonuclease n=1 Tax=Rossellomorea vietnamensis TaxID=218284 RepID=A0ACD4CG34_9BACI|nr:Sau3AI family type II restriction endonuclease [Rossellomorea vietnamensis]UXH46437.1 Sau3AI family type II restriction endonuclease [Rossellomorea vietnamensis]
MSSVYNSKEKVHKRALEAIGKTLGEIDVKRTLNINNKSYPGNVIEQIWFDHPADNNADPDFPEAGVELKVTPIDIQTKKINKKKITKIIAGERLVLNKINYQNEFGKSFEQSSFWHKNKLIELIQYYRRDVADKKKISSGEMIEDKTKFRVSYANLLTMTELKEFDLPKDTVIKIPEKDLEIIKQDWNKISELINSSKAHQISEGITNYLGACTKSTTSAVFTKQKNTTVPAKPRAYSFKAKFINELINNHIIGKDHTDAIVSIVKDVSELKSKTLEEIILSRFKPYYGMNQNELIQKLGIRIGKSQPQKNINNMIIRGILNLPTTTDEVTSEEIEKADISLKTVALRNGQPKEHFKFMGIPSFINLVNESWEESSVNDFLERKKFLLLVFNDLNKKKKDGKSYEANREKIIFKGATFWNMPISDLDGTVRNIWETEVNKMKNGVELTFSKNDKDEIKVKNNFIKPSLEAILHLRPDAKVAQYKSQYYKNVVDNGIPKKKLMNNARKLPSPAKWINRPENEKENFTDDYMTKQAWWLSKDYIYEQIKGML